jgi:hypothetical protein
VHTHIGAQAELPTTAKAAGIMHNGEKAALPFASDAASSMQLIHRTGSGRGVTLI